MKTELIGVFGWLGEEFFFGLFFGRVLWAGDVKILYNDWPYGVVEGITHLVVWTKFELETIGEKGELTGNLRKRVEDYVDRTFRKVLGREEVCPLVSLFVFPENWGS